MYNINRDIFHTETTDRFTYMYDDNFRCLICKQLSHYDHRYMAFRGKP